MHKTPSHSRVKALQDYQILDSLPEEAFDNITRLASYICESPMSLISLLDEKRQFFKSHHGLTISETPIEHSFCAHAVQTPDELFTVGDAQKDDRFKNNPLVTDEPHIRFYAGMPLVTSDGIALGSLCVLDKKPHQLNSNQELALKTLANQIVQLLELRKAHIEFEQNKNTLEDKSKRLDNLIKATQAGTWEWNVQTGEMKINERWAEILGYTLDELQPINLETWYKLTHPNDAKQSDDIIKQCFERKVEFYDHECRMYHKDGHLVWVHDRGKVVEWTPDGKPLLMMGTHTDITKKKTSEIQLQAIADNIPGVVFRYLRTEGALDQLLQISKGCQETWGYSVQEVTTDNLQVWNRIHRSDLPSLLETIEASAKNESFWTHEWRYFHPDGREQWHKGSGKPTKLKTGQIIWDCVVLDITDKKRVQQKLTLSEQRFKALVQEGSDLTTIIDTEGEYQYVSPTSKKILGYDSDDLVGKNTNDYIHPEDHKAVEKQFKLLKTQKQVHIQPYRYKDNAGEWAWLETIATNMLNEPAIKGIITNTRDITERIKQEQELIKSNERFSIVNKATNDAIYDWDVVQDTFYWGEGFQRLFGHNYKDKTFRLQDWIDLTHPKDAEQHKESWNQFMNDKNQQQWIHSFRFKRKDGSYAYVKEVGYLERDNQGNPLRMIGALRDQTEARIRETQVQLELNVSQYFKDRTRNLNTSLNDVLEYLTFFAEFKTAEVWLKGTKNDQLNLIATYAADPSGETFYKLAETVNKLKIDEGLPGKILAQNKLEIWQNIDVKKEFVRQKEAKKSGLKSAIGIPLVHNNETIGVLVFGSERTLDKKDEFVSLFKSLPRSLGAEIRRKQQEEEIQLFFDNAPDILAIADSNGNFIKVNPAFCSILGYTKEELTSQPFETFLHPEDKNSTEIEYRETISGERLANSFENRYRTKNGSYRWISWNSSNVYGEDGFAYAYGRDITEMKELQQLFENAARMARIGSWGLNLLAKDSNTMYWSSITKEIFEVTDDYNPSPTGGMEFYAGESKLQISHAVQELIKKGGSFDLELQILSGKGNLRWVRCIGKCEFVNGECSKLFGSYQDIHQRKSSEIKVKEALEERDTILESIGDAFFAVDPDWHVTYWNKEAETLLSTKKEHILGKKLWDVFADQVGKTSYKAYNRAMKIQSTVQFEDYYPDTNKWFEISAYPSKAGLSVYFKDVSIRKRAEEQIRQTNERFEKITEATQDAIWDFDVLNDKLFWGKGFHRLFGYNPEEKEPTFEFLVQQIHPEDRQKLVSKIEKCMADPTVEYWFEEYRFQKADGTYANVIDRAIFIRNDQKIVTRVLGAMTDISYRKDTSR